MKILWGLVLCNCWYPNYRPQRSWAKVIFSQACVKNSVHGGVSASVHAWIYPPGTRPPQTRAPPRTRHPPDQTPPDQTPPRPDPPDQTPPEQTPPDQKPQVLDTPPEQTPPSGTRPPLEADCSIQSTSGRYASYWNAFLLYDMNAPMILYSCRSLFGIFLCPLLVRRKPLGIFGFIVFLDSYLIWLTCVNLEHFQWIVTDQWIRIAVIYV